MTDAACPQEGALVSRAIGRLITQYREADRFKSLLRIYLKTIEDAARATCVIPEAFDLETATGDQLTLIGKRMGFPRCHCVCDLPKLFGFECSASLSPIVGFCETPSTWQGCETTGVATICIDDDDAYRAILKARRYQMIAAYDDESLLAALRHIWGETSYFYSSAVGVVTIGPGRALSADELSLLPVVGRVLPIATGIRMHILLSSAIPFGFGAGWGQLCTSDWACALPFAPYACAA